MAWGWPLGLPSRVYARPLGHANGRRSVAASSQTLYFAYHPTLATWKTPQARTGPGLQGWALFPLALPLSGEDSFPLRGESSLSWMR